MNTRLPVNNAYTIDNDRQSDLRGFSQDIYCASKYAFLKDYCKDWKYINYVVSQKNVVRGIYKSSTSRLYTCVRGKIYFVIVDLNEQSSTYGKWCGVWITERNEKQIFVPPCCGHATFSATPSATLLQIQSDQPKEEIYHWNDPNLHISWPKADRYILSEKDKKGKEMPAFAEI